MTTYRLLNRRTGNYVRLDALPNGLTDESALVNEHTTTSESALDAAHDYMTRRFSPNSTYTRLHSNGDLGDDWRALRNRWFHGIEPNGAASAVPTTPTPTPRTYRVIITDAPGGDMVGRYVVSDDPVNGSPRSGPYEWTSFDEAERAAERFRNFASGTSYRAVSRYGDTATWESIAAAHRSAVEQDNEPTPAPTCNCPSCRPAPRRPRRRRSRCELESCGTALVHHDEISERYLCDHEARERLDEGYPVTTAYAVPA